MRTVIMIFETAEQFRDWCNDPRNDRYRLVTFQLTTTNRVVAQLLDMES